jgi:ABC-2 type transport system permease protein
MLAPRDQQSGVRRVHAPWAMVIRSFAFVRKEIVEIIRQPRLVLLLVLGPFILLLLFGSGYADTDLAKRAIFVGPTGSIYEDVLTTYEEELNDFIIPMGMVETVQEGRAALAAGETDVVVVFPDDPAGTVLSGSSATIEVLHDALDPIQQGAIQVAAQLAVQEVNFLVLETLATRAQTTLTPAADLGDALTAGADAFAADPTAGRETLTAALANVDAALVSSSDVLIELGATSDRVDRIGELRDESAAVSERIAAADSSVSDEELTQIAESVSTLATELDDSVVLDPKVLVRPFVSDTENVSGRSIDPTDYFTPAALALLLQHVALTFAALSIVRDRRTGLFELMRVGPLSSIEIIIGKVLAYLIVGCAVGAALVAAAVFGLGLELAGSIAWLAAMIVGVLLASLALGMVFALVSATETQAVQYAMLALLAGLFFSGFILPIEGLVYPFRLISWLLPVTYGVQSMQDVMLRGVRPDTPTLVGLAATIVVYGALAIIGLRRRLRTSA